MPEWERVPLGDLLVSVPASRREAVDPDKKYRLLGVRLNNEGAFLRETKKGSESSAPSLYRVESGDFIYSRLFAWRGAFGLIPPELDGCYVSNEFPLFRAKDDRLDLEWLDFWFHLQDVIRTVEADCTGSTPLTRNRYKETFFLALELPLPPLPEQQRIVARVKGLLDKVEEATRLANERDEAALRLLHSIFTTVTAGVPTYPLGEVAPLVRRPIEVVDGKAYAELGVRSFGRGTFHKPALSALDVGTKKLFGIEPGDLLFNIVFAWEGAVAVAQPEDAGRVGSHRFLTCVAHPDTALPEFLNFYFQTPQGLSDLGTASPGGAGRNRTLSLKNVTLLQVPIPGIQEQQHFVELVNRIARVRKQREDLQPELQALPSAILAQAFAGAL